MHTPSKYHPHHPGERGSWRQVRSATADQLRPPGLKNRCKGAQIGPHNRCDHPTPEPPGWRRCQADPGCPHRLHHRSRHRYCRWHRDLHGEATQRDAYATIMES